MPEGTKVEKMYKALRREGKSKESAARIAQAETGLALKTGKPPEHHENTDDKYDRREHLAKLAERNGDTEYAKDVRSGKVPSSELSARISYYQAGSEYFNRGRQKAINTISIDADDKSTVTRTEMKEPELKNSRREQKEPEYRIRDWNGYFSAVFSSVEEARRIAKQHLKEDIARIPDLKSKGINPVFGTKGHWYEIVDGNKYGYKVIDKITNSFERGRKTAMNCINAKMKNSVSSVIRKAADDVADTIQNDIVHRGAKGLMVIFRDGTYHVVDANLVELDNFGTPEPAIRRANLGL